VSVIDDPESGVVGRPAPLWSLVRGAVRLDCLAGASADGRYHVLLVQNRLRLETQTFPDAVNGLRWAVDAELRFVDDGWQR
jgi:hypothetical protein